MRRRVLFWLSGFLRVSFIPRDGAPYLERYRVFSGLGINVWLHRFVQADPNESLHDHPWAWAYTLVLVGGYLQEQMIGLCPDVGLALRLDGVSAPAVRRIRPCDFHKIIRAEPDTWTLFIAPARRCKGWGFLEDEGPALLSRDAIRGRLFALQSGGALPGGGRDRFAGAPRGRDAARFPLQRGSRRAGQ